MLNGVSSIMPVGMSGIKSPKAAQKLQLPLFAGLDQDALVGCHVVLEKSERFAKASDAFFQKLTADRQFQPYGRDLKVPVPLRLAPNYSLLKGETPNLKIQANIARAGQVINWQTIGVLPVELSRQLAPFVLSGEHFSANLVRMSERQNLQGQASHRVEICLEYTNRPNQAPDLALRDKVLKAFHDARRLEHQGLDKITMIQKETTSVEEVDGQPLIVRVNNGPGLMSPESTFFWGGREVCRMQPNPAQYLLPAGDRVRELPPEVQEKITQLINRD